MDLKGKKVLIVGLGKTGEAVCRFLLPHGAKVKVSEKKTPEELGEKVSYWGERGILIETGKHELKSFLDADLIVPSPGVPLIPQIRGAKARGIKVISEIELAYYYLQGKIIGITGSNGKSTTATLTHKILKEGGLPSYLAGNIGTPLISFAEESQTDHIYVTEISSFQLEHIEKFRVPFAVLLNVSPDHLDWHPSFPEYFEAKKKIISFQKANDTALLNRDDPLVWNLQAVTKSKVYAFSQKKKVAPGCYLDGEWIVISDTKETKLMKISEIPLLGAHNQENVMASALIGYLFGLPIDRLRESIRSFKGLKHRLEKVTVLDGVYFYNDSKATNVDAALKSILSFSERIVLILGGRDKGGDFSKLKETVRQRAKKIILIGEAKEKIKEALKNTIPMNEASSLVEAVRMSFSEAQAGDVVLLAPGCTSFDMFDNFEERGDVFKKEVFHLKKEVEKERIS